uniref:HDAg domain-containing protein n=1 Tax=Steinernema glaseri TaxID=37863 RepID=A0A1I7Z4Z4_9BILA
MKNTTAPVSQLYDQDLLKWIVVKLGDTSELWSGAVAASLMTKEMLTELETCFQELDNHIKLKIILAIPHLSHRLLHLFRTPLERLITQARRDADDWIEATADMYHGTFEHGSISIPNSEKDLFNKAITQLEHILQYGNCAVNDSLKQLPQEAAYMTHFAIRTSYGCPERHIRNHFNVKHKPKSGQLLEDVTKAFKSLGELSGKGKNNGIVSSFPLRMRSTVRKPNNNLPMKGIPTVSACKQSAGFSNEPRKFTRPLIKREGGAKLLELDEIPQPMMKRRRRGTEVEEKKPKAESLKKRRESECLSSPTNASAPVPEAPRKTEQPIQDNEVSEGTGDTSVMTASPEVTPPLNLPTSTTVEQPCEQRQEAETESKAQEPEKEVPQVGPVSDPVVQYCSDLYRASNRLDQNGYCAILSFMRGNRTPHPSVPTTESVGTVKLTESKEALKQADGSTKFMLVETIFEMDYKRGEWKRLRKVRPLREDEMNGNSLPLVQKAHV